MTIGSRRYVRHRLVREEQVDEALFLIDDAGKAIHMLDAVSRGIWMLLVEPTTVAKAKSLIKAAFPGVPPKRIARDVDGLFGDLRDAGLIKHVP